MSSLIGDNFERGNYMEAKDILGLHIYYNDYLGIERTGIIGWFEEYLGDEPDEDGKKTVWLYIVDEDPEYNNKEFVFNAGTDEKPDIRTLCYAELRLSSEVRPQ